MEIGHIDHQTRQFVGSLVGLSVVVGLFLIWRDAIPALSVIGNIALWNETVTLDGQTVEQAVTLADVALAIVIAFAMVAALRNVGGVLEMILPMRLRRDTGIRFAIGATVRYVICRRRLRVRAEPARCPLVQAAMARGCDGRRPRLRPAGDRRKLRFRPDHPL